MTTQPKTKTKSSLFLWLLKLGIAGALAGCFLIVFVFAFLFTRLPDIDALTDYRPKEPLRVWSADGALIGEFGTEKRKFVSIDNVPNYVKYAVISAEDSGFYEHPGIEITGIVRAALSNLLTGRRGQGGSTITMQVARNFFLTTKRTYVRKLYEIALSLKIEHYLTKDQILEVYLNQIYLGNRSYGFESAARTYFGRTLSNISVGEAATLAGLPVAPSAYNPLVNPERATMRKNYVLKRMFDLGYIDELTYVSEKSQPMVTRRSLDLEERLAAHKFNAINNSHYIAEMARLTVANIFKDETYSRGLNIYTTIKVDAQNKAVNAVRDQILRYDRRYGYRGAEGFVELSQATDPEELIIKTLRRAKASPFMLPAVVLKANAREIQVALSAKDIVKLDAVSLSFAASNKNKNKVLRRGSIIHVLRAPNQQWRLTQIPQVEAAFIAADFESGAIKALVGGFDFNLNKFNHVTQAWRQPGSSFKPFIFSAALDRGFQANTIINDAPFVVDPKYTGGKIWTPRNYSNHYDGPMTMARALEKSKNLVSIRIMQAISPAYAQEFLTRFGFDRKNHPRELAMALGAGQVTPWGMLKGYMVFANGGFLVEPYLIDRVVDSQGRTIMQANNRLAGDESIRAIDERNAFVMSNLLHNVAVQGTGARATRALKREDLAGKTGTTNQSLDAWFCGWGGKEVAVGWMGYDKPRPLGARETGGGLILPIWINYMRHALKDVPVYEHHLPDNVEMHGQYAYYKDGNAISKVDDEALGQQIQKIEEDAIIRDQIF